MNIWFTSDLHFFHNRIAEFCPKRKDFMNGADHNEWLIDVWNSQVEPNDIVYDLGDFSFGNAVETMSVAGQLNGKHHLIVGNHEKYLKDSRTHSLFDGITTYKDINQNSSRFIMFHYPIHEWNAIHYSSIHLHGHVHGKPTGIEGKILDVGIDNHSEYKFFHIDEVLMMMKEKPTRKHT